MAYNLSEEKLLEKMITDPSWCMFYHREKVRLLLPSLAEAYLLIGKLQKELKTQIEEGMEKEEAPIGPERIDYRLPGDN